MFSARVYSVIVASVVLDYADLDATAAGCVFHGRLMFWEVSFLWRFPLSWEECSLRIEFGFSVDTEGRGCEVSFG